MAEDITIWSDNVDFNDFKEVVKLLQEVNDVDINTFLTIPYFDIDNELLKKKIRFFAETLGIPYNQFILESVDIDSNTLFKDRGNWDMYLELLLNPKNKKIDYLGDISMLSLVLMLLEQGRTDEAWDLFQITVAPAYSNVTTPLMRKLKPYAVLEDETEYFCIGNVALTLCYHLYDLTKKHLHVIEDFIVKSIEMFPDNVLNENYEESLEYIKEFFNYTTAEEAKQLFTYLMIKSLMILEKNSTIIETIVVFKQALEKQQDPIAEAALRKVLPALIRKKEIIEEESEIVL
jgi:hypothetical protein